MRPALVAPLLVSVALVALSALCLQGCGGARVPSWGGNAMPVAARVENPAVDALRGTTLERTVVFAPEAFWAIGPGEWGDSLALVEFPDELVAYAAFQELASVPEDASTGSTVRGDRVCFRRGRWIGSVPSWSWKGASWYDTSLGLPDGPRVETLPDAFASMLHQERVAGSERVLTREVLGGAMKSPALAVAMDCRGDTAWLYAAGTSSPAPEILRRLGWRQDPRDDALFLREIPEMPPARLRFSKRGAVAVEGCFDPNLTDIWIKNQYSGLNNIENSLNTLKSLSFD